MIKFHFYNKDKYWLARVIRWVTKGYWNHVSIGVDAVVWEAIGMRINHVVCSHSAVAYHQGKHRSSKIETIGIQVSEAKKQEVFEYLKSIEGKPYDKPGAMSFLFFFIPQSRNALYCSEIGINVLQIITGVDYSDRLVSPSELYDLLKSINTY